MSERNLFISALAGWPIVVFAALAARSSSAGTGLGSEYAVWLFLATAPLLVGLAVMRGRSFQVRYDTPHPDDQSRERSVSVARG